uniref:Phorbol-ester/DAG-type domain-containing protein n=1 Tax=Angiostrongylus costaricensis TaxID=334426 RepID=A0A0R3PGW9_ANGCS
LSNCKQYNIQVANNNISNSNNRSDNNINNPSNNSSSNSNLERFRKSIDFKNPFQIHPAEHIWLPSSRPDSSASVDSECYVGDKDCRKIGEKRRCAACHIVAHTSCFSLLAKLNLNCKVTFHDHTMKKRPSKEMIDSLSMHHWIHKWRHEGRCSKCEKSFQQKMFNFQQKEKETMAVVCSWCKESYHLRNCFTREKLEERCNRGQLKGIIVPPNWIFRLPSRHRSRHKQLLNRKSRKATRQFVVKPNDWSTGPSQPLVVFVNPKSGGNKVWCFKGKLCFVNELFTIYSILFFVFLFHITHYRIYCAHSSTSSTPFVFSSHSPSTVVFEHFARSFLRCSRISSLLINVVECCSS